MQVRLDIGLCTTQYYQKFPDLYKKGGQRKLMMKTSNHFGRDVQDYLS